MHEKRQRKIVVINLPKNSRTLSKASKVTSPPQELPWKISVKHLKRQRMSERLIVSSRTSRIIRRGKQSVERQRDPLLPPPLRSRLPRKNREKRRNLRINGQRQRRKREKSKKRRRRQQKKSRIR